MSVRTGSIKAVTIVFFVSVIGAILIYAECILRRQGYEPGWYYPGIHTVAEPEIYGSKQLTDITIDSLNVIAHVFGNYPLNKQGFISAFDYDTASLRHKHGKKVMVIGDSFTQGAIPDHDSTYVARISRMMPEFVFLNFGVAGTDPLNYELILRKYLPIVKPDLVVVAFCGGNDEMTGDDHLAQNKYPIMWNPNFIWGGIEPRLPPFLSKSDNEYFPTIDSLYSFLLHHYHIKGISQTIAARCFAQTCLSTRLWFAIHAEPASLYGHRGDTNEKFCHKHLKQMRYMCDANHIKMILAYIPPKDRLSYTIGFPYMQADCYYPTMQAADYDNGQPMDIHWGDKGHETFSLFLKPIVEKYLK